MVMDINLEEKIVSMDEVEITASSNDRSLNDMATVSARTFSIENTDRYAGSRGDPARMAANFAGVMGANDSRNDIVVRGNSPLGVLYRIQGLDMPNPSHFAIFGSAGGPVSILNNKTLSNSDFMTSAFPAEYGNAISGVFDLKLRNGNDERHEFMAQIGVLGLEAMAEGPFSKKSRASYMVAYRYSTFQIVNRLGIKFGSAAVPNYQDLTFKVNVPTKAGGNFEVFGLGGKSDIEILNCERSPEDIYDDDLGRNVYFGSRVGMVGANYLHLLSDKTFLRVGITGSASSTYSNQDSLVFPLADCGMEKPGLFQRLTYTQYRIGTHAVLNHKFNARHSLRSGIKFDRIGMVAFDSVWNRSLNGYQRRADINNGAFLLQAYSQWKYKINENLTLNAGLHGQFFFLTSSWAAEPRIGLRYNVNRKHSLTMGYGLHSQIQQFQFYYQNVLQPDGSYTQPNKDLDFTRSQHAVLGWDYRISRYFRTKVEVYYQNLWGIPVDPFASSFSLVNGGIGFDMLNAQSDMVNEGTGYNYGIEFTLEKFYNKGYFFLVTASGYDSRYKGSDDIVRSTTFNGNYIVNVLGGKEFKFGKKKNLIWAIAPRFSTAGGQRYTPIDIVASEAANDAVYIDSLANTVQLKAYYRLDLRTSLRINRPRVSHEIAIDLLNMLDIRNELTVLYNPDLNEQVTVPQLPFTPIIYYKIEFGIGRKNE